MAADLAHYYRIDIRELFRAGTTLTPRYVLMLVEHLPEDSALAASMRGGREMRAWTTETHLSAAVVNLLAAANHQRAGSRRRFKPIVEPPKPARKSRVRTVTVAALLARQRGTRHPN